MFATRDPGGDLAGLPELAVAGLPEADARLLLDAVLPGPIDARVRDQIIAETRGNPLALLELPRGPDARGAGGRVRAARRGAAGGQHRGRASGGASAPCPSRPGGCCCSAAADPSGDPALVWRAAARLGIGAEAAAPAAEAGLAEFGTRLRFRHPLVRSAAYQSAPGRGPARGAPRPGRGHRSASSIPTGGPGTGPRPPPGPDEGVAAELERSASRAQARGGLGAAAAFLKQAATLTLDPARRAGRALAAAQAKIQAGAFDVAAELLDLAEAGPLSDLQQAHADLARAQLAFVTSRGSDAPPLLVKAAGRLELIDPGLSRATYLDALSAGDLRRAPGHARQRRPGGGHGGRRGARRRRAPRGRPTSCWTAWPRSTTTAYAAGMPMLRRAPGRLRRRACRAERGTALAVAGLRRPRPSGSGMTSAGTRCRPGTSSWPAIPGRSASFRSP